MDSKRCKWSLEQRQKQSKKMKEMWSNPEIRKRRGENAKKWYIEHGGSIAKGCRWTEEQKRRQSEGRKEYFRQHPKSRWNEEQRQRQSEKMKVIFARPGVSEKRSMVHKRYYEEHPEFRVLISKRLKEVTGTQESRKRHSERLKKYWTTRPDEERKARALRMRMGHSDTKRFSSKGEKSLCKIIQQYYPTAEGSRWIAGYQADIVLYEHKINIEYDGVYWHRNPEKDKIRDELLQKLGWTILRVREGEVFDIDVLHKLIKEKRRVA